LNDIIDSVVRDQVSGSELVELVRSASWEVPRARCWKRSRRSPGGADEGGHPRPRGDHPDHSDRGPPGHPQYGIELVDVRIKRLNYVESVREKVYARMISSASGSPPSSAPKARGAARRSWGPWRRSCARSGHRLPAGPGDPGKADAEATKVYGAAFNRDPEFYAFSRTLEAYKEGQHKNSTLILTTDADYYRYFKDATGRTAGASRPAR